VHGNRCNRNSRTIQRVPFPALGNHLDAEYDFVTRRVSEPRRPCAVAHRSLAGFVALEPFVLNEQDSIDTDPTVSRDQ
jgi:hypothetical protein